MNIKTIFWEQHKERQWQQKAIDRAYERFAGQHPEWVAALFDRHFLDHAAADALRDPLGVQPLDLAKAYANQFCTSARTHRQAERWAMPAASDFVRYFRAELDATFARLPLRIRLA